MKNLLLPPMLAITILTAPPARGNDSEAATALGGLVLKQSEAISMDSEDLFISAQKITVKYRFTNHSPRDIKTLVSFPLPPLPSGVEGDPRDLSYPVWKDLHFQTRIDGKPAALTLIETAEIKGRDVTAKVKQAGLPLRWFDDIGFLDRLEKMEPAKRSALVAQGLVRARKPDEGWDWMPTWQVVANITREQVFAAGKTVVVEHSYDPLVGGSVGGGLDKDVREGADGTLAHYRRDYCVDADFITSFDRKRMPAKKGQEIRLYSETWIDYILSSGANWMGPIKDFRLVVDKGGANNLVSFCMTGVRKIAPTQFEVRKTNFEPRSDLHVLIVKFQRDE
jgi:hypothetical protein